MVTVLSKSPFAVPHLISTKEIVPSESVTVAEITTSSPSVGFKGR